MATKLVVYRSKYGTTARYAQWIAEDLGADCIPRDELTSERLAMYDVIVYGGGLYAGGISGVDAIVKQFDAIRDKTIVLFTVGLADPAQTDYSAICDKNIPAAIRDRIQLFHLQGGIDYKRLSWIHKAMMAVMKRMTLRKADKNDEDRAFLETYGKAIDFTARENIKPLVNFVLASG